MRGTVPVHMRADAHVKEQAEKIYNRYGLSLTDAIRVFLSKSVEVDGLPFDLRPERTGFATTMAAIRETEDGGGETMEYEAFSSWLQTESDNEPT